MRTWVSTGIAIATSTVLLTFCFGQQLTKAADPARPTLPLTTPTVELNRDHQAPVVYVAAAIPQSDEAEDSAAQSDKAETSLKYGDNRPDGKKSLGGTGEMIKFTLPNSSQKVRGLRIHAARYGTPQAPNEDVEITFENEARDEVVGTREVAYGKFRRGTSRWVTINFDEPVEVPSMFWVTLDFDAGRTKGVYVSYDTASGGEYSKMGLPGADAKPVDFGGDWMIQALLTKPM